MPGRWVHRHGRCALAQLAAGAALLAAAMMVPAPVTVEAKAPGVKHCYRGVCHRVRTLEQTQHLIGRTRIIETSYYDAPGVDRFNVGTYTSNGERFNANDPARVASADLPDGTELLLRNPENGRVSHVRVNDFGPFRGDRRLDVTRRVADDLGFRRLGVTLLEVTVIAAPKPEDLAYRRNRPRQPTRGHLGSFQIDALNALIAGLVAERRKPDGAEPQLVAVGTVKPTGTSDGVFSEPTLRPRMASAVAAFAEVTLPGGAEQAGALVVAAAPEAAGTTAAPVSGQPEADWEFSLGSPMQLAALSDREAIELVPQHPTPAPVASEAAASTSGHVSEPVAGGIAGETAPASAFAEVDAIAAAPMRMAWGIVPTLLPAGDGAAHGPVAETRALQVALAMFEPGWWWGVPSGSQTMLLAIVAALSSLLLALAFWSPPTGTAARLAVAGARGAVPRPRRRTVWSPSRPMTVPHRTSGAGEADVEISATPPLPAAVTPGARMSVISAGMSVCGVIRCKSALAVGGEVAGRIEAEQLHVRAGGRVDGDIRAHTVTIDAAFSGRIFAHTLVIGPAATVSGEIAVVVIEIAQGAVVEADFRRLKGCWRSSL